MAAEWVDESYDVWVEGNRGGKKRAQTVNEDTHVLFGSEGNMDIDTENILSQQKASVGDKHKKEKVKNWVSNHILYNSRCWEVRERR